MRQAPRIVASIAVVLLTVPVGARPPASDAPAGDIPFADAASTFEILHESWPAELRGLAGRELPERWPAWVRRRDEAIRARLDRGHEDSIVNFWLYGTSFTARPRAIAAASDETVDRRLEDLLGALQAPGSNERLQFARDFFRQRNMDPASPSGRARIRRALVAARQRARAEQRSYERAITSVQRSGGRGDALSVHATLYRDRGLSSDTSMLTSFAVEQALRATLTTNTLRAGSVRRVALVGPGLDFTNKADGYDFYPQQSIQPFALIDSLLRLGLAPGDGLRVTTFDLSPRINEHLTAARARAARGQAYPIHLPLDRAEAWRSDLLTFWRTVGSQIADDGPTGAGPWSDDEVAVRALRVRSSPVLAIEPRDLNIVVQRLVLDADARFDLIVATNVLVYYDRFEQSLAMANAAAMLRAGGVLITNSAVFPIPPLKGDARHLFVTYSDRLSEHVFWYQRQ